MADWPHAPIHRFNEGGTFMITAGTYQKQRFFYSSERLQLLQEAILSQAKEFGWQLHAWAVLANHYHFVAVSPDNPVPLSRFTSKLHMITAKQINAMDATPGRRVWFQYWDSRITYQRSYLARLQYVHSNPVHHQIVQTASEYPFCSAAWFEQTANASFQKLVAGFKTDRIQVMDDF